VALQPCSSKRGGVVDLHRHNLPVQQQFIDHMSSTLFVGKVQNPLSWVSSAVLLTACSLSPSTRWTTLS
jgi:hypothetical protein